MKCLLKYILSITLFILVMLMNANQIHAEMIYQQFSLGSDSLTTAPSDVKIPEPGVVTAKYGFKIAKDFMPYMGTGLAYIYQPDTKSGDITKFKTGVAAQIGFNLSLSTNSVLKLDYKYLSISPDMPRGDNKTPPQSLGIGLDIKF